MPTPQTKEDYDHLCRALTFAAHGKNGIELGNACHKLRCRYGLKYKSLWQLAGLLPVDFDELVKEWDDAEMNFADHRRRLDF